MSTPLLEVEDLRVRFRTRRGLVHAVNGITFDVRPGETLGLVGESGCGKSTLARSILQLLEPTSGSVRFEGEEITGLSTKQSRALRSRMQMVFQDPSGSLNPVLSVGSQIAEIVVAHRGATWRSARMRAGELLERVRIPQARARLDSFPHEFSGGQRQRIALAAALAVDPRLLIADEPTSALDTVVQRELVLLLDELVKDKGLTLLFVTHDIALASELASEVAVLLHGRLVENGSIGAVFASPAHPYTKALLATRLDLDTPPGRRLPEIDLQTFEIR